LTRRRAGCCDDGVSYTDLLLMALPEAILTVTALLVLLADLARMRQARPRTRRLVAAALTSFGCLFTIGFLASLNERIALLDGMMVIDPLTQLVKQVLLL
jgi:NADH:ubiquinone oxidoreductase subunit 2 (subunit N)